MAALDHRGCLLVDCIECLTGARPKETHERPKGSKKDDNIQEGNITSSTVDFAEPRSDGLTKDIS